MSLIRRSEIVNTAFVLPAFFLHFFIIAVPTLSLIYFSLTDWKGVGAPNFIGLKNFSRMIFEDGDFHHAVLNNILYMSVFLTIPIVFGLLMALLTVRAGRFQLLYRALFFLPYVVSPVISGKIFMMYYDPFSGINQFFEWMGWSFLANINYVGDRNLALFSVAFVDYWHWWGFVLVIFLAALHQVDVSLYEAAELDGANRLQRFLHVTVPQIRPTLVTLLTITIIGSFVTFDYVYVMTQGGPAGATEIASTWIFKQAFNNFDAGYGSALSITVCAACVVVYFGFRRIQRIGWDI